MDDLTAFLVARLDEDEAAAKAAREVASSDTELAQQAGPCVSDATYVHIERHGPARVLREVAAGRAILAEHHLTDWMAPGDHVCFRCVLDDDELHPADYGWLPYPCPTVRAVAAIYSDHPDYRPEWKP